MAEQTCAYCYETQSITCFNRKSKQFKTCNTCSIKMAANYRDGKITGKTQEESELYNQLYYIKHRDRLLARSIEARETKKDIRITCPCGKNISILQKYQHNRSKKHTLIMEKIEATFIEQHK